MPGDLVVFGPGTGDHVVVIVAVGSVITVVSHGQEAGPIQVALHVEADSHKPPVRFLRCPGI
jgi:hypothetical protein